jgi:pimeloyl-ACP methyl ester carboxylesterase
METASHRLLRVPAPLVATLALFVASCSSVKVSVKNGQATREAIKSANLLQDLAGAPTAALAVFAKGSERLIGSARAHEWASPRDAAACYMKAAIDAHRQIASGEVPRGSTEEKALIDLHNHSLARFVELWMKDPRRGTAKVHRFECEGETFEITLSPDSTYKADYFDRAVSALCIEEKGVQHVGRDGWGAPVVGIRDQTPERAAELKYMPKKGLHTPATLTMDSLQETKEAGTTVTRAIFSIRNPMLEQSITIGGRTFPVCANFSAPMAVVLNKQSEALLGLKGFFDANQRAELAGLYLYEPYDPDRIPVVLIHGLISVPMIWRDIVPAMLADPEISKRYQMVVFGYPSGLPIVESADLLRDRLAEMRRDLDPDGNDPLSRNMVVAGHSMGGILTHTLVVEMGDHLWRQFNQTSTIDQLPIDEEKKAKLRKLLYFEPDPAVQRAFYFSAPHRGAYMAEKGIAEALSKLAKLPSNLLQESSILLDPAVTNRRVIKPLQKGTYTSAQSLIPGAPMVAALDKAPYRRGVVYHSVMGDRGKGDTPNSSDGVVEYWSAHQAGAASELIVPTDHGSYKHPRAIEDLKRVLREHAGLR